MKCLIIDGGPRQGNTWKLAELVQEELSNLSREISFEEIHLKDIDLPYCTGCSLCFRKGHEHCPNHAAVHRVLEKIAAADSVIFVLPAYNMHVPAMMKNWMDHLCFLLHCPRFFDKVGLVVTTTGGVGAGKAARFLAGTAAGWGFNRCYRLPVAAVSWNDYHPSGKHQRAAAKAARRLYTAMAGKRLRAPAFSVLIPYNLFRGMSPAYAPGTAYPTYDGVYWKESGLLGHAYAPQVPLPFYKKAFAALFFHMGRIMSKHVTVTYKK